jgi:hypothetical protein
VNRGDELNFSLSAIGSRDPLPRDCDRRHRDARPPRGVTAAPRDRRATATAMAPSNRHFCVYTVA